MEKISLPSKIDVTKGEKENEKIISIQPCHPGYGTTLGNALRRILLSSLPGGAVIAFKIKGASHEFSSIPHIKEDGVQIALNLKQLRPKIFSDKPVKLELKVRGEKKVTAADIKASSDVEIANPDLLIATLTNKNAELDMEILVSQGRGYVTTENQDKKDLEVGMIAIDSVFTPIINVGIEIENVRVGQITNYEHLILTVQTDGTITPEEALQETNQILIDHFNLIADNTKPQEIDQKKSATDKDSKKEKKPKKKEAKK